MTNETEQSDESGTEPEYTIEMDVDVDMEREEYRAVVVRRGDHWDAYGLGHAVTDVDGPEDGLRELAEAAETTGMAHPVPGEPYEPANPDRELSPGYHRPSFEGQPSIRSNPGPAMSTTVAFGLLLAGAFLGVSMWVAL